MEGRCQRVSLAHQDRVFAFGCDDFDSFTRAFDLGSADEDHLDRFIQKLSLANGAVDLASVSVAAHGDVESAESGLLWILYIGCQQDATRAGTEARFRPDEIF